MEDSNGRAGSEAPSSTSSDFYGVDAPKEQPGDVPVVAKQPATNGTQEVESMHNPEEDDDGDSSSEMDVSASSRSASPEPEEDSVNHAGLKRKLSDAADALDALEQALPDPTKKRKLSTPPQPAVPPKKSPADSLPAELWQQVFLRLSPAMLSRCLRVSKGFNTYLTNTKAQPVAKKDQKKVRVLDSDTVWAEARKTYFPNMPRPLMRCNELGMLQLIGGKTCQFCNRPPRPVPATSPFNAGPGPDGLRVVWPFGIRTCGQCWEHNTLKDVQILVSPAAALRFGLPYAFRTPELHFVPEMTRQLPGGIPSHLRVAKVYYNRDVQAIQEEYDDVKGYGEGTAGEWRKGLATKGKEAMVDAARWEKWESQMRLGTDLAHVLRECDLPSFPNLMEAQGRSAGVNGTQPPGVMHVQHALPQPVHAFQNGFGNPFQASNPQFQQVHRPMRNPHQVEEARAARKADIERRCMELEPPLEPSVLQHIDSFQAAMQITTPMNDAQWEMLRPRILAQRETAELMEHQRAEQLAALQAAIPSVVPDETFLKPAKEVYDREYELAQEPLRKRLGEYADELINGQWHNGQGLDRDSAPSFAIQVMLHVRKQYLEDKRAGNLPEYDHAAKSGSSKQGTPAPDPFLSLDNMKWVYDNKVRSYTDQYRRELFICAGCAEERKPKWFAFEGLIQHYGAKHTTAFSRGNIVVHWQTAGWPDEPPFHTNPSPWIKMDRKVTDYKAHRARNTPQQIGNGPFVPPSPGIMLSENPLFSGAASPQQPPASNGYYHGSHGLPAYQPAGPHPPQRSLSYQAAAPAPPAVDMDYDTQLSKLSSDAREVWDSLEGVDQLLECVRIQTVIHHVVTRFTERFQQRPNLDLLTDALATNVQMRSIKNAHGLACKLCVASQTDGSASYQSYYARIRNVKLYNASSLITHFKIQHQPEEQIGFLDWSKDMIELPETQLISDLVRAPGMDDEKLALVAEAFPKAFPLQLPKIGLVTEAPPDVGPDSGLATRLLHRLNKTKKQGPKKKGLNANGTPGREGSQEVLPEPAEDEYDPRRPMYTPSKDQAADPARFDTDLARKPTASVPQSGSPALVLPPETLAVLNSLTAFTAQNGQAPDAPERSPSVGRAEPVDAKPAGPLVANGTPATAPDISAILASLTGHMQPAQTATPPTTISNPSSATHPHYNGHRPAQDGLTYRPESRRSSGRYVQEPAYRASAEPPPTQQYPSAAHDLQAVLARNTRQYEQNQQVQHTYAEVPPVQYAPQPQPSSRSPPRYRYFYEDEQQPQYQAAPQHQPMYREQQPPHVQYIQMPPQQVEQHSQQQYAQYAPYERAPKPIYVDEYGRPVELIPIDSAPAPVQYAPHPFEQQQQQQQYARQQQQQQVAYSAASPMNGGQYGTGTASAGSLQGGHFQQQQPVYYEQQQAPVGVGSQQQQQQQHLRYAQAQAQAVYDEGARVGEVPRS